MTLNEAVARSHAQVIIKLSPDYAYLDACDVNTFRYAEMVKNHLVQPCEIISEAIGRFKLGKEQAAPVGEGELPVLEGSYPQLAEDVTTSDEEIKLGFVE